MSTRAKLRRKVVLAVTVSRSNGTEKQLAHTLDITETTARLGGLVSTFEPGEMIDIQRGAIKGRFQVVWMGIPGTSTERQVGVRSMEPNKVIWGVELPRDERDMQVDIHNVRRKERKAASASATRPAPAPSPVESKITLPALSVEADPARVLVAVCKTLAANFEAWSKTATPAEMEELRQAVSMLQQRLATPHEVELMDYLSTTLHTGGRA